MNDVRRDKLKAPTLLQQLRSATRVYHHALDHHPELQRLLRPELTFEGYGRSLLAMHAPQAALEGAVVEGATHLGLAERLSPRRLPALEADLAALGVSPPDANVWPRLPKPRTDAELLGFRYVLEGSRLGAEVIVRRLRDTLGDTAPLSFFSAPDGNRHWCEFVDDLTSLPLTEEGQRDAVAAACRAFAAYQVGLGGSEPGSAMMASSGMGLAK